jgi:putative ABC transport system permease protein
MFAADPNILGQTVTIAGEKQTIIGILPPGFSIFPWDMHVDVWAAFDNYWSPYVRWLPKIGRLKHGVTSQQAQAELNAIARGMEQHQHADDEWSIQVASLQEDIVGDFRGYFYLLQGAVGFILLIACANVANLLLARSNVRQREIAIRASLGAGRLRLIRQLLAESTLLALAGGAVGVLLGFWGIRILISTAPMDWVNSISIRLDLRVLAFTFGVSVLTAILFGLLPAFRASRPDLQELLKGAGRQSQGGSRQRGQGFLLVSEIALAIVLLVGAGLMISSFIRMHKVDLGFNPRNVLSAQVFLDGPKFWYNTPGKPGGLMKTITPEADIFYRQLLERVERIPGVIAAGISHLAPPGGVEPRTFQITGRPAAPSGHEPRAGFDEVSAGYFRSLDIPILKGRYLTERDDEASPWVVVINDAFAQRYFPHEDPIGRLVQTSLSAGANMIVQENRPREIVGVVGDVRQFGYGSNTRPTMYGSYHQHGSEYPGGFYTFHTWKSITLRTAANPASLVVPLQKVVNEIDKDQALFDVHTMEAALLDRVGFPRFEMRLFGIFGGLALVLAAVGIYGVMSYLVTQRTHEIGLRVALGARRSDVLGMVLGRGIKTTLIGLAAGIAASLALTRLIARFLYGVKNTDPLTYAIVALILIAVALLACYVPAHRAAKVDPMVALRHE